MFILTLQCALLSLCFTPDADGLAATPEPDPTRTALAPFFEALRDAEDKRANDPVRIAWWGDSAIVGDGYTGALRARLQQRFGDGGPGFMLPSTTFGGYLRKGVRLKRHHWESSNVIQGKLRSGRYGYGGIHNQSFGGAGATFRSETTPFDSLQLFYRGTTKSGTLQIFVNDAPQPNVTHDTRGEAADGFWTYQLPANASKVRIRAGGKGLTQLYGVILERDGPGVVLDALGLLGIRARRWLKADAEHLAAQVRARKPRLIVVNFGGNERVDRQLTVAKHQGEIEEVLARFKAGAPGAACMVVAPIAHGTPGGGTRLDPALATLYEAQRAAAASAGCAFMDTVALMGGPDSLETFRRQRFMGRDLSHLNAKGHRHLGALMADWLLGHYDAWKASAAERQ